MQIEPIAYIYNDYVEKFGIPKQSGIINEVVSRIEFCDEYRDLAVIKGMEEFEYIWLIFGFSRHMDSGWSKLVKPPRLGGKKKMGVFATRSPYRPNSLGLSSVKIDHIDYDCENAPIIYCLGADLLNQTPIYDIKPYIAFADSHKEAKNGLVKQSPWVTLEVDFPKELLDLLPQEKQKSVMEVLSQDPRPAYDRGINRDYKLAFGRYDIWFDIVDEVIHVKKVLQLS